VDFETAKNHSHPYDEMNGLQECLDRPDRKGFYPNASKNISVNDARLFGNDKMASGTYIITPQSQKSHKSHTKLG